jgi:hypothetical protein
VEGEREMGELKICFKGRLYEGQKSFKNMFGKQLCHSTKITVDNEIKGADKLVTE